MVSQPSQNWPVTQGVILSKRIVGQQFEEYDGDLYLNLEVYLRYEYKVGGESYASTRLNAVKMVYYPKEITEAYHEGKLVDVYYHPRSPALAVLEPGLIWSPQAFDVFSVMSSTAGLYLIVRGIKLGLARKSKSL